jgi:CMP-N-acetylneuraminic acid synthetase
VGTLALIPARGGSKGISRKNLQEIQGKSLVCRAFESAQKSGRFDEIWISSEDAEILSHAKALGALTHPRAVHAANDSAQAEEVVLDFLKSNPRSEQTSICYLQPTSPFRTADNIRLSIERHYSFGSVPVIGVKRARELPEKMLTISEEGILKAYGSSNTSNMNRQRAPVYLYPNGALYVFTVRDFELEDKFPISGALPFLMSELESLDIDSQEDLLLARRVSA